MGNNQVQSLPVDTVNGCIVRGDYTKRTVTGGNNCDTVIVDFKQGVSVKIPKQNRDSAFIMCSQLKNNVVSVRANNLSNVYIFGSDKTDVVRANECQNCVFDTSKDDATQDQLYIFNAIKYHGRNRFLLGMNDQGYVEFMNEGKRIIGKIDTGKK